LNFPYTHGGIGINHMLARRTSQDFVHYNNNRRGLLLTPLSLLIAPFQFHFFLSISTNFSIHKLKFQNYVKDYFYKFSFSSEI